VVANPTALHPTLIVDGVTGYLASTPEEWSTAIARLVSSPDLRRAIGRAARLFVERNYSTTVWGPRLAAHYLSLVRGKVGQAA
jgi:glycosyltransferase involved in cell wall biosynthesis